MSRIKAFLASAWSGWDDVFIDLWRKAIPNWGIVFALLFMGILGAGIWAIVQLPGRIQESLESPPAIPPQLADHRTRGDGLERGPALGATPNKSIPRPEQALKDQGISYKWVGSPNWSGRGTNGIEAIVVHVTGPGSMAGMDSWFNNPSAQVSAHFGIGKDGSVHQYVEIGDAAWHAGICNRWASVADRWCGNGINPNLRTVGIEVLLAGPAEPIEDFPKAEKSLEALLRLLLFELNLDASRVTIIGHYEIDSINRSTDPRCCMDLDEIAAGLVDPGQPVIVGETPLWSKCLSWKGRLHKPSGVYVHQNTPLYFPGYGWQTAPRCS